MDKVYLPPTKLFSDFLVDCCNNEVEVEVAGNVFVNSVDVVQVKIERVEVAGSVFVNSVDVAQVKIERWLPGDPLRKRLPHIFVLPK